MNKLRISIDEYEGIDKSIIEMIYMEGNKDVDPYEGVIDSGCPKTVAGKAWIDAFIESKQDMVTRNREEEYFRFGPSKTYKSSENHEIDVEIGKLKDAIKVSVVEVNIPLLIGLDCQKRWGMVIDVDKDSFTGASLVGGDWERGELVCLESGKTWVLWAGRLSHHPFLLFP